MNLRRACGPGGRRNAQGNLCFHKESGYDASTFTAEFKKVLR